MERPHTDLYLGWNEGCSAIGPLSLEAVAEQCDLVAYWAREANAGSAFTMRIDVFGDDEMLQDVVNCFGLLH